MFALGHVRHDFNSRILNNQLVTWPHPKQVSLINRALIRAIG